jgi:hypothetical protein
MLGDVAAASMSMMKLKVLQKIVDSGVVEVVQAESSERAARIAGSLRRGRSRGDRDYLHGPVRG